MKLLWLDLKTTGLDPTRGKILEVAAAVADLQTPFDLQPTYLGVSAGSPPDAIYSRVCSFAKWEHWLMDDYVRSMHTKNGLLVECERASSTAAIIEGDLLSMLPEPGTYDRENTPTLAGSSVHFDHAWLRVHMPTFAARLSHRHYDVSAVKLFCQSLGMTKPRVRRRTAPRPTCSSRCRTPGCARRG